MGIASLSLAWFAFCGFYTATLRRSAWRLWPLVLIPLTSLLLVLTNERHGLIWAAIHWDGLDAEFVRGWWSNYVYLPYGYLLIGLGSWR